MMMMPEEIGDEPLAQEKISKKCEENWFTGSWTSCTKIRHKIRKRARSSCEHCRYR